MADFGIKYGSPSNLTLTNLGGLAATNIWQSGKLDAPEAVSGVQVVGVEIWYNIELANSPTNGNGLVFRIAEGSEGTPEIWPAGLGESEGQITSAANKQRVISALPAVWTQAWQTNMPTSDPRLASAFEVALRSPDWQLLIEAQHGIDASPSSAHVVTIRYFHIAGS